MWIHALPLSVNQLETWIINGKIYLFCFLGRYSPLGQCCEVLLFIEDYLIPFPLVVLGFIS
jgi:hypothetical protein